MIKCNLDNLILIRLITYIIVCLITSETIYLFILCLFFFNVLGKIVIIYVNFLLKKRYISTLKLIIIYFSQKVSFTKLQVVLVEFHASSGDLKYLILLPPNWSLQLKFLYFFFLRGLWSFTINANLLTIQYVYNSLH